MKRLSVLFYIILFVLPAVAFGVERFPPPEFTTGYQLPHTTAPAARAAWLAGLDVLLLFLALSLASYLVLKKRSRRGVFALLLGSLAYFGFYRHGCVCAVGSLQNVAMALGQHQYALPLVVGIFFLLPLIFALFFGRVFCAAVCPLGAVQDVVLLKAKPVPAWLAAPLELLPYLYLGAAVLFAATGSYFLICRFDPFVAFFRFDGEPGMLIFGAAMLALATVVARPYCRFLCPYGALLRLLAPLAKWRVSITPDKCVHCRLCEEACPFGAIQKPAGAAEALGTNRRQLTLLLLLLPLLLLLGGWLGAQSSGVLARLDAQVRLADQLWLENHGKSPVAARIALAPLFGVYQGDWDIKNADSAFRNSGQSADLLFRQAAAIRAQYRLGSALFGAWLGLLIGISLLTTSLTRRRTDYRPDPARCLSCARCYQSCPREHARLRKKSAVSSKE